VVTTEMVALTTTTLKQSENTCAATTSQNATVATLVRYDQIKNIYQFV
ncbi:2024_t:CDS:1, partial [Dentiscutata heterogama]